MGLSSAENPSKAKTEVYIDDLQHLTRSLAQGLETLEWRKSVRDNRPRRKDHQTKGTSPKRDVVALHL